MDNDKYQELREIIKSNDPDVFLLNEVDENGWRHFAS